MGILTGGISTQEEKRRRSALAGAFAAIFGNGKDEKPEEGVTKIGPLTKYRRDKKVGRWRYEKGMRTLSGKALGGRFVKVPPEMELKMGMKRPVTRK